MTIRAAAAAALATATLAAAAGAAAALDRGTATLVTRTGPDVTLRVEIARTAADRHRGLMYRRYLAPKAGMVFVFQSDSHGGFWMKNTLIPLDIAYVDRRGKILRIMTMTPCRRDPCRVYDPGVPYRSALEVNAGSFRRWNVHAGDRIVVRVTTRAG
jgi:uncharacterized membrane protein (UPF0127 family)